MDLNGFQSKNQDNQSCPATVRNHNNPDNQYRNKTNQIPDHPKPSLELEHESRFSGIFQDNHTFQNYFKKLMVRSKFDEMNKSESKKFFNENCANASNVLQPEIEISKIREKVEIAQSSIVPCLPNLMSKQPECSGSLSKAQKLKDQKTVENSKFPHQISLLIVNDNKSNSNLQCCRICYEPEEPSNKLLQPCNCEGSMKYIHEECLKKWIETNSTELKCEICNESYFIRFQMKKVLSPILFKYYRKRILKIFIILLSVLSVLVCIINLVSSQAFHVDERSLNIAIVCCICSEFLLIAGVIGYCYLKFRSRWFEVEVLSWSIIDKYQSKL